MQLVRSLVHDLGEAFTTPEAITPLKPFVDPGFAALIAGLQKAIATRYRLLDRNPREKPDHNRANIFAAASEAVHVQDGQGKKLLKYSGSGGCFSTWTHWQSFMNADLGNRGHRRFRPSVS